MSSLIDTRDARICPLLEPDRPPAMDMHDVLKDSLLFLSLGHLKGHTWHWSSDFEAVSHHS